MFCNFGDVTNFTVFMTLDYYGFFSSFITFGLLLKPCDIFFLFMLFFVPIVFCGLVRIFSFFWCIRTYMCLRLCSLETDYYKMYD